MKLSSILLLPALLRSGLAYTELSDDTLRTLPRPGPDFDIKNGALLAPILRTRVPGTPGSEAVLDHFIDFFTAELPRWRITFQNSSQVTPVSNGKAVPFKNLIATRDPPWAKNEGDVGRLALVAHYDSKLTPEGFIGATDSAAPCAMLMHAARSIDAALTSKWDAIAAEGVESIDGLDEDAHKGVQILLLDGEEAFHFWTHDDSLYGARSLAEEWEGTMNAAMSTYKTPLHSIDLFVLLDLLGAKQPRIPSYFKTTHWAYKRMASAEHRLRKASLLKSDGKSFFPEAQKGEKDQWLGGYVEDDHVPFMARGVEVLHVIPNPFPSVWHKIEDDGEHLDIPTCEDWAVITTAFAAEWLDLEGHFETKQTKRSIHEDNETWAGEKTELFD
ncbi:glutaminyl-peptide cyclotransferase [Acrodontium crateriforme]|uniref:Peptide hydrolase n=1 Tax=Acrodontium crateriforme TaxID=150365 RepID=A0AAQ3MBW0_9PEZI|nr:glutaminyl-peptide cyclotransferase [Acrodontium crateriforme]